MIVFPLGKRGPDCHREAAVMAPGLIHYVIRIKRWRRVGSESWKAPRRV